MLLLLLSAIPSLPLFVLTDEARNHQRERKRDDTLYCILVQKLWGAGGGLAFCCTDMIPPLHFSLDYMGLLAFCTYFYEALAREASTDEDNKENRRKSKCALSIAMR